MGLNCTDSLAVLDALAPEPGWETDLALFSSYSVDLVAVAAIVVALAGEGDDHERLGKAPLARACERMRDRLRVVCQAGRVAVPTSEASTLVLADRWIREVRHDGNERSWHAKLALVRYRSMEAPDGDAEWRLWLGSRNLTRDTSWDSALTALGRISGATDSIDQSVARAGAVLADKAALPEWSATNVEDELRRLHWQWPEDIQEVVSFAMWPDAQPAPRFPRPPRGLRQVVAVSPFVNGSVARKLSGWGRGDSERRLLTTPSTLAALAPQNAEPLAGFSSLHQIDVPAGAEDADADRDETGDDQMVEIHRGLHAKLVWTRSTKGDELWLGSANLTERAWDGRNTEAVVHARVAPQVGDGLVDGLVKGLATEVLRSELVTAPPAENPAEQALDRLRNRIAGTWDARLERGDASAPVRCETGTAPLRDTDGASLSARLLGQTGWVRWAPNATAVELPAAALHRQTELVELELRSTEDSALVASWVARAVMHPPIEIARDRAVLARWMGPRAFLKWLRTLLDEVTGGAGDDPWPERPDEERPRPASGNGSSSAIRGIPTLESVLRAWIRNPAAVRQADRALETWAREIRNALPEDAGQDDQVALRELECFEAAWDVIRNGLDLEATGS